MKTNAIVQNVRPGSKTFILILVLVLIASLIVGGVIFSQSENFKGFLIRREGTLGFGSKSSTPFWCVKITKAQPKLGVGDGDEGGGGDMFDFFHVTPDKPFSNKFPWGKITPAPNNEEENNNIPADDISIPGSNGGDILNSNNGGGVNINVPETEVPADEPEEPKPSYWVYCECNAGTVYIEEVDKEFKCPKYGDSKIYYGEDDEYQVTVHKDTKETCEPAKWACPPGYEKDYDKLWDTCNPAKIAWNSNCNNKSLSSKNKEACEAVYGRWWVDQTSGDAADNWDDLLCLTKDECNEYEQAAANDTFTSEFADVSYSDAANTCIGIGSSDYSQWWHWQE